MDIVSFETAKRLKEAGFPYPAPAFGQIWYSPSGKEMVYLYADFPAWTMHEKGEYQNIGVINPRDLVYAPSATELFERIPHTPVICDGPGAFAFEGDFTSKESLCELLAESLINA